MLLIVNVKLSHQGGSGGGHQIWVLLTFSKIAGALVQCQIVILLHAAGPVMTAKSWGSEINNIEPSILMSFIIE